MRAILLVFWLCTAGAAPLAEEFAREVDRRLELPLPEQAFYGALLGKAIAGSAAAGALAQYFVLVDRSPQAQAVMIYWRADDGSARRLGGRALIDERQYARPPRH